MAAIATGGKLLKFAQDREIPHIALPGTGIQPRSASGLSIVAMARIMGLDSILLELEALSNTLDPKGLESQGEDLAKSLEGSVPVIYASNRNHSIANNWKILRLKYYVHFILMKNCILTDFYH